MDLLQPVDPNERYSRRRRLARRRRRLRRALAGLVLVGLAAGFAFGAHSLVGGTNGVTVAAKKPVHGKKLVMRQPPKEIRGIHLTMALANVPGKFKQYLGLRFVGLNTIELDVKDEVGDVAFVSSSVPLAR